MTKKQTNIARGITDPEIDSVTWIKFSNNISCKFGHQMAPLALVANVTTRLHRFEIGSSA